jgi:hypothetical protein
MGCWNETCALSGLPIYGGDECYRIVFNADKIKRLTFCAIDNPTDYANWVEHIELGKYDEYGRLKGSNELSDISDCTVFILKHFWDLAPSVTPEYAEDCIQRKFRARSAMRELIAELGEKSNQTVSSLLCDDEGTLIDDDTELYAGFVHAAWWMSMLRRTFYTAGYRGAQSSMQPFVVMNEHINDYIKEKD